MTQHTMRIPNGILHYSTVDLIFEFEGKPCHMVFHRYCGPFFMLQNYTQEEQNRIYEETGEVVELEEEIFADDSPRFNDLWKTFYKWFDAPEQQHLHYKEEN